MITDERFTIFAEIKLNVGGSEPIENISIVNPHLPCGLFHPYQLDESISNFRDAWCIFSSLFNFEYIFLLANSEDPDQTPSEMGR